MKASSYFFSSVILCLLAAPSYAQVLGFNGKWVLNHAKSQGDNPFVTEYISYRVTNQLQEYSVEVIGADGSRTSATYEAAFDGKDHPKKWASGEVTYTRVEKVFERVELVTNSRKERGADGKEFFNVTDYYIRTLSHDGQSISSTLFSADGKVTAIRIFDRLSSSPDGND